MLDHQLNEFLKSLAWKHLVKTKSLFTDSMICYPVCRPVVSPNFVTKVTCPFLLLPIRGEFSLFLLSENLVQFLTQTLQSFIFVFRLFSAVLTLSNNTRWDMSCSASTVCLVYALTSCSLRTVKVKSYIFHVQREFSWHIWHHKHNCSAWMQSSSFLSLRHSLHFMHTWFMLQMQIRISPRNMKYPFLHPLLILKSSWKSICSALKPMSRQ